jgi:hypothetical protein
MNKDKHIGKYQIMVWSWKTGEPVLHKKHFIKDIDKANKKRLKYQLAGFDVLMWQVGKY